MYVLTNVGIVSALGVGAEETTRRLFTGDTSGMKPLTGLAGGDETVFGFAPLEKADFAASPTRIAALMDAVLKEMKPATDALLREVSSARIGAVVGTSNSAMEEFTDHPDRIDMGYPAAYIQSKLGLNGPAWSVSTACSSSAKVFASARRLLDADICDAVIVGGADAYTRTVVEGFHALEALAPKLTRPLCADREGINLGEGAALFILRKTSDVSASSVCLLGVGESSDAHHLTAPHPEGAGAEAAMRAAIQDAGLTPDEIDYVNLHGTGTTYNDAMECAAVARVFGSRIACTSTKSLTGHCLGAAGAIEASLCFLALREGRSVPPHTADPIDSSLAPFNVPPVGNTVPFATALSNSFAFGGSNASLVLGRCESHLV